MATKLLSWVSKWSNKSTIEQNDNSQFHHDGSDSYNQHYEFNDRPNKRLKLTPSSPNSGASIRCTPPRLRHEKPSETQSGKDLDIEIEIENGHTSPNPSHPKPHRNVEPLYDTIHRTIQQATTQVDEKRSLRSRDDGNRIRSELALFFPDFENVMNNVKKGPEKLNVNTKLTLIPLSEIQNGLVEVAKKGSNEISASHKTHKSRPSRDEKSMKNHRTDTIAAEVIDLSGFDKAIPHHPDDPLGDEVYLKAHRKAERREKGLRNIEKEKAMFEKAHLERLLDGLKGHDWLKTLGVVGGMDCDLKALQEKRDHFITEIKLLLKKFQRWRDEEKRIKADKDIEQNIGRKARTDSQDSMLLNDKQNKTFTSSSQSSPKLILRFGPKRSSPEKPVRLPTPEEPLTSFYTTAEARAKALGMKDYQNVRLAFGHPVVEIQEGEFQLPPDYISHDALKESARRRRRLRRESAMDTGA